MKYWIIIFILLAVPVNAADVSFTITDSTGIEDVFLYGHASLLQANYGRGTSAGRTVLYNGIWFTVNMLPLLRMPHFTDTCDEYYNSATHTLVTDSLRLRTSMHTESVGSDDTLRYFTAAIDSTKEWGEGNRDGGAAQDCEACYDSAQKVGVGSCATKEDWGTNGAVGAGDSMYTSADTLLINDGNASTGDTYFYMYVNPDAVDLWITDATANEGVGIYYTSVTTTATIYWYGAENPSAADSVPLFEYWGHTEEIPSGDTPNVLHDKSADPTTGALHDKQYGGSVLHEP